MSPPEWLCIQMGSAGSHSKVSYIVGTGGKGGGSGQSRKAESKKNPHNFWREMTAEMDSNLCPPVHQLAFSLVHTGSQPVANSKRL